MRQVGVRRFANFHDRLQPILSYGRREMRALDSSGIFLARCAVPFRGLLCSGARGSQLSLPHALPCIQPR